MNKINGSQSNTKPTPQKPEEKSKEDPKKDPTRETNAKKDEKIKNLEEQLKKGAESRALGIMFSTIACGFVIILLALVSVHYLWRSKNRSEAENAKIDKENDKKINEANSKLEKENKEVRTEDGKFTIENSNLELISKPKAKKFDKNLEIVNEVIPAKKDKKVNDFLTKNKIKELENKMKNLKSENEALKSNIETLKEKNSKLETELVSAKIQLNTKKEESKKEDNNTDNTNDNKSKIKTKTEVTKASTSNEQKLMNSYASLQRENEKLKNDLAIYELYKDYVFANERMNKDLSQQLANKINQTGDVNAKVEAKNLCSIRTSIMNANNKLKKIMEEKNSDFNFVLKFKGLSIRSLGGPKFS